MLEEQDDDPECIEITDPITSENDTLDKCAQEDLTKKKNPKGIFYLLSKILISYSYFLNANSKC